ncbi:MAG: S-adenosyl-l-methionine hydroxide adenosyltransferase family protein [Sphaerochaeta sp.]|jgi:S-adenosylmethionine hydrolase|nr:S-adenosyl-l-methionine hydroxide adenosyltransferase family protein [Sphaerochaeta sp.]MDX9914615.1 S-adenosyl-l-methionine hydroxide adenosyltransferase family protein [Sphaerochaeta sp.]
MKRVTKRELLEAKVWAERRTVVFLSDFGTSDGAVSAMHGVANAVSPSIGLYDLTHDVPQFNIWEASYRLAQSLPYWAAGTVFVCVVDPGVGSDRKSIVALTESGHLIVTPDNGTLTHISDRIGLLEVRSIEGQANRLAGSQKSHTFFGRDVYAYTGARLAAGEIAFEELGETLTKLVKLKIERPRLEGGSLVGSIDILDARYGSLWTNIPGTLLEEMGVVWGDDVALTISKDGRVVYGYHLPLCKAFTDVKKGQALVYVNSLLNLAVAINQGSFATEYHIGTGEGWKIVFSVVS